MKLGKLKKNKPFIISLGMGLFVITVIVVLTLVLGRPKTPAPHFAPAATAPNANPQMDTKNPELYSAQKDEIEYLKKHGRYFGSDVLDKPIEAQADKTLHERMLQQQRQQRDEAASREAARKAREKRMLWAKFWNGNPPGRLQGEILGDPMDTDKGRIVSAAEVLKIRPGCPVGGELLRGSYGLIGSPTPVLIKITDPANCAGLPAGTIVIASARADYSVFRAITSVTSVSLPDGRSYKTTGEVLGSDGLPGVGYKVVRNDRKGMTAAALLAGIGAGANAISTNTGTTTIVSQSGIVQQPTNQQSNMVVGLGRGVGAFGTDMANGLAAEYSLISPIVVTMPQGLPVEVVFGVKPRQG